MVDFKKWLLSDQRAAAEIMMDALPPWLRGKSTNLGAGPAASQIFSPGVMQEQVDP